jgi:hypothetical protein
MTDFEKTKLDIALKDFTLRNFEKPEKCKNSEQIRYYVRELCLKIEEYESKFQYVPEWAYTLLTQYNSVQNNLHYKDFHKVYAFQS